MKGCKPFDVEEVEKILATFDESRHARRDRAFVTLGVKTGFRVSELLSLTIGDVWQAGKIVDRVTVRRGCMKGKIEGRTVALHADAKAAIVDLLEDLKERGYLTADCPLFLSQKGNGRAITRQQAYDILHNAARAAGVSGTVGTHSLRKTFAAVVYERLGREIFLTQQALGHKDPKSTASYLSFRQEDIDAAILA